MKKLRPMAHRSALYWHRKTLRKPLAFTEAGHTSFNWTGKKMEETPVNVLKCKTEGHVTVDSLWGGLVVKEGVRFSVEEQETFLHLSPTLVTWFHPL